MRKSNEFKCKHNYVSFFCVILLLLTGCITNSDTTGIYKNYKVIPFYIPWGKTTPVIKVINENSKELNLAFDTGCFKPMLFDTGFEKTFGTIVSVKKEIFPKFKKDYESLTGKRISNQSENIIIQDFNKYFPLLDLSKESTININSINHSKTVNFIYSQNDNQHYESSHIDGIIGIDYFYGCKNIIIDYKNQVIVIDGPILNSPSVSMTKNENTTFYEINVKIDNMIDKALIDTGASFVFLKNNYGNLTSELSKIDFKNYINSNVELETNKSIFNISLEIGGNLLKDIPAIMASDKRIRTAPVARNILLLYNSIGYPVFKNHKIQLNFERNEFRIE